MSTKTIEYFKQVNPKDDENSASMIRMGSSRFRILSDNIEDLKVEIQAHTIFWKGETCSQYFRMLSEHFNMSYSVVHDIWRSGINDIRQQQIDEIIRKNPNASEWERRFLITNDVRVDYDEYCLKFIEILEADLNYREKMNRKTRNILKNLLHKIKFL